MKLLHKKLNCFGYYGQSDWSERVIIRIYHTTKYSWY